MWSVRELILDISRLVRSVPITTFEKETAWNKPVVKGSSESDMIDQGSGSSFVPSIHRQSDIVIA